jgi:5'-methylthioadenosine phosphorylase|tara:strand:+ start:3762 stop:4613 length:852 start_codon:yes stop_codon:yes gene_type:complete
MYDIDIAFIGGSGLYKIPNLKNSKWIDVKSNFGKPSSKICIGSLNKLNVAFLPRHGLDHNISPSMINYKANIECLKKIGVKNIFSLSAVGSLRQDYVPGDFVVINQFIDHTYLRQKTFFDDECVVHISMASPVCDNLRDIAIKALNKLQLNFHDSGTYICIEGPQFSSQAESNLFRSWGCDVIGMTNMPEAKLAKEAGICYSAISMVTDFDCWHPEHDSVTVDQIVTTLNENSKKAFRFIDQISRLRKITCDEKTKNLSNNSIITKKEKVNKSLMKKLKIVLS